MRFAIISDLHGNYQAWQAVLAHLSERQFDTIVCLGDIIGYGPQPAEVLHALRAECHNFILGNHDAVAAGLLDPSLFNEDAQRSTRWTLSKLSQQDRAFFTQVPLTIEADGVFFSHATLANPAGFGYLDTAEDAAPEFSVRPESAIFIGHTHHAKAFQLNEAGKTVAELPPENFHVTPGYRYIINPGSVGDPRTPDSLARYGSYDTETGLVEFYELPFDVDAYRSAWRASGSPYQQYFHCCIDGDIPISDSRIAPPPALVARGIQQQAAAPQTVTGPQLIVKPNSAPTASVPQVSGAQTSAKSLARPSSSQRLSLPNAGAAPNAVGAQRAPSGAADSIAGAKTSPVSKKLIVEEERSFPWTLVVFIVLALAIGTLVYLRYFSSFSGVGFNSTVSEQIAPADDSETSDDDDSDAE